MCAHASTARVEESLLIAAATLRKTNHTRRGPLTAAAQHEDLRKTLKIIRIIKVVKALSAVSDLEKGRFLHGF